jgi:lipoprotein-anchoring transpeptidase ErfK/SrfK
MDTNYGKANEYIVQACEALKRGDKETARQLSTKATQIVPGMENAWLLLAFSASSPRDALACARRAIQSHPESQRARQCLRWAHDWEKKTRADGGLAGQSLLPKAALTAPSPAHAQKANRKQWLYTGLLIGFGCVIFGLLGLFALTTPALASIVRSTSLPFPTEEEVLWASMTIPKLPNTPQNAGALDSQLEKATVTRVPTQESTPSPSQVPEVPAEATVTPGTITMEIVEEGTVEETATQEQTQYPSQGNGLRWIDVNLSEQRVYAYEGDVIVNSFLVSTGLPDTPTVTGEYQIYVKVPVQDMSGPGYYLPDVPWVMYFYDEYGFHGTYWHNNFGRPMSRGCVNMTIEDAKWLFDWASVGTKVDVHY